MGKEQWYLLVTKGEEVLVVNMAANAWTVVTSTRFHPRRGNIEVYVLAESEEYTGSWARQTASSGNRIESLISREEKP